MKTKTNLMAGGGTGGGGGYEPPAGLNHTQRGLAVKTSVKAGKTAGIILHD